MRAAEQYNYFRDYDPAIGRYIQSDPLGLKGGINTFGYVGAMPLVAWDDFGLACQTTTLIRDAWELAWDRNIVTEDTTRIPKYDFEWKGGSVCYRYVGDTVLVIELVRNLQFWQQHRYTNQCSTCKPCGESGLTCSGWIDQGVIDAKEIHSGPWLRYRTYFEERDSGPCVRINRRPPGPKR